MNIETFINNLLEEPHDYSVVPFISQVEDDHRLYCATCDAYFYGKSIAHVKSKHDAYLISESLKAPGTIDNVDFPKHDPALILEHWMRLCNEYLKDVKRLEKEVKDLQRQVSDLETIQEVGFTLPDLNEIRERKMCENG